MIQPIRATLAGLVFVALWPAHPVFSQVPNAAPNLARVTGRTPAPPPVAPATVSRSADGGVTVRAVRISLPMRLDGRLDEAVYTEIPPISDFVQQEPQEGTAATERTDAWILFDDENLYVSARCWDSQPGREIANEMRRDGNQITQNENFAVIFDSFHDKRNGIMFQTNPLGALRDTMSTDEGNQNQDWNTVWDVRTERSDQGWTVEIIIPFKSLRYGPGREQTWGVNIRRVVRWKNEWSFLSPLPAYLGPRSIIMTSLAATMVGLEVPASRRMIEIKPYGISALRTDRLATPVFSNKREGDFGADAKYAVTKGLTLDLTYNTDFAQVEDDTQQVNLTRFNLLFPERREFFLEGQGIFAFGGVQMMAGGGGGGGGGAGGGGGGPNNTNTPVLFFSRRIGLNNGRPVPIAGGGRLTGRAGDYSVGVLSIQSKEDEASASKPTNFSVFRLKRNLLGRSNVGVLYTRRAETGFGAAVPGETFGIDGLFSLSPALNLNAYYARTRDRQDKGHDDSHLVSFDFNEDRYGLQAQRLRVGTNFNPQVGFLRRTDFSRSFVQARFSPRPNRNHWRAVRRFIYVGNVEYIENNDGRLDWREQEGLFEIELFNSDRITVDYTRDYEFIPEAFDISTGVTVPSAGYTYQNLLTSYLMGTQHRMSGTVSYQQGSLYGGTKRAISLAGGRTELSAQFALEPTVSINWVHLPFGTFTTTVVTERTTFTITPRMFVSALTQYSSSSRTFSTNARFRWEYQPGSEMFVVYSDGRETGLGGFPTLVNRAFIVKINRFFRF